MKNIDMETLGKTSNNKNKSHEIVNLVKEANNLYNKRFNELNKKLSIMDRKKSDIEHYIELKNLDASSGFGIYKKLQQILLERRAIKDEIDCLSQIRFIGERSVLNKLSRYDKKKNDIEHGERKYTTKVMTEEFGEYIY